jgi:hypothetical protein
VDSRLKALILSVTYILVVHVLEHAQLTVPVGALGVHSKLKTLILSTTYILVVHVLEHAQLTVGALGVHSRLEWSGNLLDGHLEVGAVR